MGVVVHAHVRVGCARTGGASGVPIADSGQVQTRRLSHRCRVCGADGTEAQEPDAPRRGSDVTGDRRHGQEFEEGRVGPRSGIGGQSHQERAAGSRSDEAMLG
jgi:hypothetical protein